MRVEQDVERPATIGPGIVTAGTPPLGRRLRAWLGSDIGIRIMTALIILALWEGLGLVMAKITFASASRTVSAFIGLVRSGQLTEAWAGDLGILLTGLGISSLLGISLGFLVGRYRMVDRFLQPGFNAVFMTQKVALIPIVALWLGYQTASKVIVVILFSFFDLFFTVRNGVKAIDAEFIDVARTFQVPERQMMRKIVFPATLPYVTTGLRLGLLHGMVGIVLAGFMLENTGIGGLVQNESARFRLPHVFAILLTVMAFGIMINVSLRWAEARFAPWSEREAA